MKTVTQDEKTGRRALLASSGAMLAGLGVLAGASAPGLAGDSPDVGLIADCAAYCAVAKRIHDMHPSGKTPIHDEEVLEEVMGSIYAQVDELAERIIDAKAVTAEGHMARARCFVQLLGEEEFEDSLVTMGMGYDIIAALVRDLAGVES